MSQAVIKVTHVKNGFLLVPDQVQVQVIRSQSSRFTNGRTYAVYAGEVHSFSWFQRASHCFRAGEYLTLEDAVRLLRNKIPM